MNIIFKKKYLVIFILPNMDPFSVLRNVIFCLINVIIFYQQHRNIGIKLYNIKLCM